MAISMLKIRRPLGRLIFNMGIAIPGKTVFLIETAPCFSVLLHTRTSGKPVTKIHWKRYVWPALNWCGIMELHISTFHEYESFAHFGLCILSFGQATTECNRIFRVYITGIMANMRLPSVCEAILNIMGKWITRILSTSTTKEHSKTV